MFILAQWIKGFSTSESVPRTPRRGIGRQFGHSEDGLRKLITSAWINLKRWIIHGAGVGLSKTNPMNTTHHVLRSEEFLSNPQPMLVSKLLDNSTKPASHCFSSTTKAK